MDLPKVLLELHQELTNLDAAIVSLERLLEIGTKRPLVLLAGSQKPDKKAQRKSREKVQAATADPQ